MNFEGISNMQRDHFIQLDLQSCLTLLCIKTIAETAWGCEESLQKKKQQLRQKVKNTAQELSYQFSNLRGAMGEFSACWQPPSQCSPGHQCHLCHAGTESLPGPCAVTRASKVLLQGCFPCTGPQGVLGLGVIPPQGMVLALPFIEYQKVSSIPRFFPFPVCKVALQPQPCREPPTPPSLVPLWRC